MRPLLPISIFCSRLESQRHSLVLRLRLQSLRLYTLDESSTACVALTDPSQTSFRIKKVLLTLEDRVSCADGRPSSRRGRHTHL